MNYSTTWSSILRSTRSRSSGSRSRCIRLNLAGKRRRLSTCRPEAGANQFHGSGFEFHRNDAFDARELSSTRLASQSRRFARTSSVALLAARLSADRTFFLRQLRRHSAPPLGDPHVHRPSGGDAPRRFLDRGRHLRSVDDFFNGNLHSVCQQPDSVRPYRSDRVGISAAGAAADRCHASQNLAAVEDDDAQSRSDSAFASIIGSRRTTTCWRDSAPSTPTSYSLTALECCKSHWYRALDGS